MPVWCVASHEVQIYLSTFTEPMLLFVAVFCQFWFIVVPKSMQGRFLVYRTIRQSQLFISYDFGIFIHSSHQQLSVRDGVVRELLL